MANNTLVISLIACIVLLFGGLSALVVLDNAPTYTVQNYATGNAVASEFSLNSNQNTIGVLISTTEEEMETVAVKLESKGAKVNRHKAGKVISAIVPQDVLQELADEGITPLPNRPIQAFSFSSEINADSFISEGITGSNVKVAIIDSGVSNANVIASRDFTGSGTTDDEFNHGNKIAQVILEIAPNAQIINAKVLDKTGLGSEAGIVAGINYAIDQGADVISISSGGLFDDLSSPMVAAVEDAVAQGIVVVAAAGNCGECGQCGDFKGIATPGNSPSAITVGAEDMCISPGKDYGNYIKPDVVANGNVLEMTGTSISTPFVSGAVALILEKYSANPNQVKLLIEQNAVDLGDEGKDIIYGSGKLNLNLQNVELPVSEENAEEVEIPETIESNREVFAFGNPTTNLGNWNEFLFYGTPSSFRSEFLSAGNGFIHSLDSAGEINKLTNYVSVQDNYLGYNIYDIKSIDANNAYASGNGKISRFTGGSSWTQETLPDITGFKYNSIDVNSNGVVFAGGYNASNSGIMLKKVSSWTQEAFAFGPIQHVAFVNLTVALAVSSSNESGTMDIKFYIWNNGVWSMQNQFTENTRGKINSLKVISENLAYAVGNKGTIMVWNGNAWTDDSSPVTANLLDVDFYDSTNGFAVGSNATILQHSGSSWTVYSQGETLIDLGAVKIDSTHPVMVNTTFYDVDVFSAGSGYLYGAGYDVLYSEELNKNVYYYTKINFKLDPTAPYVNIPVLYVPEGAISVFNLSLYSDAVSFSVAPSDLSKCTISGSMLIVDLGAFTGLESCQITASRDSLNVVQDIAIEAVPAYPLADLAVSKVLFTGENDVQITVENLGRATASNIDMRVIDVDSGVEHDYTISSIENRTSAVNDETVSFTISRGSKVVVIADYTNSIREESESNNRFEKKYMKKDVYLDINVQGQFDAPIRNYLTAELKEYNVVPTQTVDTDVIHIDYNLGDSKLGCSKGTVFANGNAETKPYFGLIYSTLVSGRTTVYVCGARIEGLVAALRVMNKDELGNNKISFLGRENKAALNTFDFMKTETPITPSLVERALYGGLASTDKVVRASDGTWLRLRNYKPIVSTSFMDYLFAIDPSKPWLEPVIMAGGLWSDITAWEEAGKEIAMGVEDGYLKDTIDYAPRDVWLIELTGGPGMDCDTCDDYTYEDVVNYYWPASVAGVLELTGRGQAAYVGHSNGGRVALDSLSANSEGITGAVLIDGTPYNLPSNPISTYIGVGVPGAFEEKTSFSDTLDDGNGARIVSEFSGIKQHIKIADVGAKSDTSLGFFVYLAKYWETTKISLNLFDAYVSFISSTSDIQPGNIDVDKATIISGNDGSNSDSVVPVSDEEAIFNNINSADKELKIVSAVHWAQTEDKLVKTIIKKRLNE